MATRACVAAFVAVIVADGLKLAFPIYAMLAAVIVTDLSPAKTRQLGMQRLAGTVLGAALGAALSTIGWLGPAGVGIGIFISILLCHFFRIDGGAKLTAYICALVLMQHGAHPWSYAFYRLIETILGSGVAFAVSLVPKLLHADVRG
jgi:uncharacterized membrane protein YgaE (UPF0421/DUF939 family)